VREQLAVLHVDDGLEHHRELCGRHELAKGEIRITCARLLELRTRRRIRKSVTAGPIATGRRKWIA
jgi:hypothetical protein